MMYLVLTALLALNVSAEILNAFKTVNNSIIKSNDVITEKNNVTYRSLDDKLRDNGTKLNVEIGCQKQNRHNNFLMIFISICRSLKKN